MEVKYSDFIAQSILASQEVHKLELNLARQGVFPDGDGALQDCYSQRSNVVKNLYNYTYNTVLKYGFYNHITQIFLTELFFQDSMAYNTCIRHCRNKENSSGS